ncbi:hypothetical protein DYI23_20465 [Roseibium polysiphoniae]|uniref:Uncharacterized protein n=1 Tax=Roseibium polysiphoniae TaxID=2571221 RepID=A0A944GVB7_9HYPH|nr:hypothetical protein [Roseibium polysiphoniae]MBS8262611.1 hypothetical protein [Roseibium polysiphoniae]
MARTPRITQLQNDIDALETTNNAQSNQIAALNQALSNRTDDQALMQSDTGTHYQNTYTYFYVPATVGDGSTTSDDAGLGAILRLGQYSDMEQSAYNAGEAAYAGYFPAHQIETETDAGIYTNAAGGRNGILLACDGRILVKAGEKMSINATSDIHLESTEGTVTIESGTNTDGVAQNIYIAAADGLGDIEQSYYKSKITINGEEYTKTTSVSRKYYEHNKYEIYKADSFKEIYANTSSTHHGGSSKLFMGGKVSLKLAAEFHMSLAAVVSISVLTKLNLYGWKFDVGHYKFDICQIKAEIKKDKVEITANEVTASNVGAMLKNVGADMGTTAVKAVSTVAEAGAVVAKNTNLSATMNPLGAIVGMQTFM